MAVNFLLSSGILTATNYFEMTTSKTQWGGVEIFFFNGVGWKWKYFFGGVNNAFMF